MTYVLLLWICQTGSHCWPDLHKDEFNNTIYFPTLSECMNEAHKVYWNRYLKPEGYISQAGCVTPSQAGEVM